MEPGRFPQYPPQQLTFPPEKPTAYVGVPPQTSAYGMPPPQPMPPGMPKQDPFPLDEGVRSYRRGQGQRQRKVFYGAYDEELRKAFEERASDEALLVIGRKYDPKAYLKQLTDYRSKLGMGPNQLKRKFREQMATARKVQPKAKRSRRKAEPEAPAPVGLVAEAPRPMERVPMQSEDCVFMTIERKVGGEVRRSTVRVPEATYQKIRPILVEEALP